MYEKKIDFVTYPQELHTVGDGFRVHNFIPQIPGLSRDEMDPFVLLDYNARMYVEPGLQRGVGPHPHRGFSTVTFAYHGSVVHRDSNGNRGIIHAGDVQWMTAAGGVLHEELFSKEFADTGGDFQMVQLWVNLPSIHKMDAPSYQTIRHDDMAKYRLPNNEGVVEVVSGKYRDVEGPAQTVTDIRLMTIRLNLRGHADFLFPESHATALIVISGAVEVNGIEAPQDNLLKFKKSGEHFVVTATEADTVVLVMSGEPMHEPINGWGPFIMNTHEEIKQAYQDFGNGIFGTMKSSIE